MIGAIVAEQALRQRWEMGESARQQSCCVNKGLLSRYL
jgi:hypothetical protein